MIRIALSQYVVTCYRQRASAAAAAAAADVAAAAAATTAAAATPLLRHCCHMRWCNSLHVCQKMGAQIVVRQGDGGYWRCSKSGIQLLPPMAVVMGVEFE